MTVVEWLLFEIKGTKWKNANWENKKFIIDQAREMEKQEKHAEYMRGWKDGYSKNKKIGK